MLKMHVPRGRAYSEAKGESQKQNKKQSRSTSPRPIILCWFAYIRFRFAIWPFKSWDTRAWERPHFRAIAVWVIPPS